MSKKLLIAVLSLMFCSFGIATADIGPKGIDDELPMMNRSAVTNPNAPGFNERTKLDVADPDAGMGLLERPIKEPRELTVFWPPDYFCEYINTCQGYVWTWLCPTEYPAFLTRMTVDAEGYTCTLKAAYVAVEPLGFTGSPDLIVEVRDGDLTTVRGSVTVPFASLPTTAGYATVDLTSIAGLVYNDGDRFTITIVDPGGGNVICMTSDNGGVEPSNALIVFTGTGFGWWGADGYNLDVGVDLCCGDIPYTNCVRMNYLCEESNALGWYIWSNWSLANSYAFPKTHYFQQFQVAMPCTVTAIGIADFGSAAWGYGSLSHGIDWMVCPDDGAGWPDTVNYFEKGTIAWDAVSHTDESYYGAGIPPLYSHVDLTTEVLVGYTEPFYLVWNISATSHDPLVEDSMGVMYWITDEVECGYATKVGFNLLNHPDAGIDPEVILGWNTFMMYYGGNFNLGAYVDVCQDEFGICKLFKQHCDGATVWFPWPNTSGTRRGAFQKFNPLGLGCRIEKVRYAFGDASETYWGDGANMYGYDCYMIIRDVATDALLTDSILIPTSSWQFNMGGDYTLPPAWYEIDLAAENVRFDAPVYVGATCPDAATYDDGVYILSDYDECYPNESYLWYPGNAPDPTYVSTFDLYGTPYNFHIQIDVCCIPPPERDCEAFVGGDWPTAGHDFRRTAASWNTTGDARCKQYLAWMHADVTDNIVYTRPVIYDGILLVAYNNKLQAFDIAASDAAGSSVTLWKIEGGLGTPGMPIIGTGFRNSITVHNGYVYFGGGNAMSFNRVNVYTGSDTDSDGFGMDLDGFGVPVDPGAWTRNVTNGLGFAGNTTYTTSVVLDIDGTDVLFVASEGGDLYALYAATGAEYTEDPMVVDDPGWTTNPVMLDGNVWASLSSNGIDMLYAGTAGSGTGGTLYAIDAATGTIVWSLYAPDDLYGIELDHANDETSADSNQFTEEFFQGPAAVDMLYGPGDIYIRSSFNYPNEVNGPPSGVRYKITAAGDVVWYGNGRSYWQSGNASISSPVLDANYAYFTAIPTWTTGSAQTAAVVKEAGNVLWESDDFFNGRCYVEGALDCRMYEADLYYQPNTSAQFLAIETDEGEVVFEYNYLPATSYQTAGVAIDPTHIVFTSYDGDVFCLKEGVDDRARLRILVFDELASVPFFSPDPTYVTFEDVFMNNGCVNLTGSIEANEEAPVAMIVNSVHPDRIDRMMETADQMVVNSYPVMSKTVALDMSGYTSFDNSPFAKDSYSNMAAYAEPDWLNNIVVSTYDLAEGETFSVEYNVNGPLVTRGPHYCYVTIHSDNDDYFINSPASSPVIQLGVLGGCMEADAVLTFGETDQNLVPFDNTGEFMCQEDEHMTIDDNSAAYWQGGLVVASSEHSIAFSLDNWSGTHDYWNSLLPEINCFDQCEPVISDVVVLGYMWDGTAYAPVEGYYGAAAFIDSVVDFACDDQDWNWDNVECLYDNDLTMGLHFDEYAYGAIDAAEMNNFVVYRVDVTNRNDAPTDPIHFGNLSDWDLQANASDVFMMDADHSIMWGFSCNASDTTATWVYGYGKIPMGMGDTRVRTLDAGQAMWGDNETLDSAYIYMTNPGYAGATYQNSITWPGAPCNNDDQDREAYFTFTSHTFEALETFSFGYYVFGFNAADPHDLAKYQDLAVLVNAWAGFNRGDIDADGAKTLADNTALFNMVYNAGPGPLFQHTADVAGLDGLVDAADIQRFADYWWGTATLDEGWVLPYPCPER